MNANPPLHVVLFEPEIPPNTGNVARLCAATGCRLHLVQPLGFAIDDKQLKRAGLDYWHLVDLALHQSLEECLAAFGERVWFVETRAGMRYDRAAFQPGDAIVFGKETTGLPARIVAANASRTLHIPMRPNSVRSINLSTSAGIVTYAALAAIGFPDLQ